MFLGLQGSGVRVPEEAGKVLQKALDEYPNLLPAGLRSAPRASCIFATKALTVL